MCHRCSNAKQGPHSAYNAYKEFFTTDTTALLLAASMEHFGLQDVAGKHGVYGTTILSI